MSGNYVFNNWAAVILYSSFFISLLFSFKAPRDRWRRYGSIYVAWIVAFYIEMFGIPFSLYVLSYLLRFDFVNLMDPRPLSLFLGSALVQVISQSLVIIGISMTVAGWVAIYYARGRFVSWGPYSLTRHPQYTGLMLIATGLLINFPTIPTIIMYILLLYSYVELAKREERELKILYPMRERVHSERKWPNLLVLSLILAYLGFIVAVYFKGPIVYGVGLYQVIALIAILCLMGIYLVHLKKLSSAKYASSANGF